MNKIIQQINFDFKKIKTWMWEAGFVLLFLLISLFFKSFEFSEIICSLAVLFTFMHGQVSDRMREQQESKESPEVKCYRFSIFYYFAKEATWVYYFYLVNSYAALLGAIIFLLYPFWRKIYRKIIQNK